MAVLNTEEIEIANKLRQQLRCVSPVKFITMQRLENPKDTQMTLDLLNNQIKNDVSIVKTIINGIISFFK